jgi:hypothetical protein
MHSGGWLLEGHGRNLRSDRPRRFREGSNSREEKREGERRSSSVGEADRRDRLGGWLYLL